MLPWISFTSAGVKVGRRETDLPSELLICFIRSLILLGKSPSFENIGCANKSTWKDNQLINLKFAINFKYKYYYGFNIEIFQPYKVQGNNSVI